MPDTLKIRNPRSGELDYEIAVATAAEIAHLAGELRAAQPGWLASGVDARIEVMQRWKQAITAARDTIFEALSTDTGRRTLARGEIFGVCGMIDRWCAAAPDLAAGTERPSENLPDVVLRSQLDPYPVLGVISPWNFPALVYRCNTGASGWLCCDHQAERSHTAVCRRLGGDHSGDSRAAQGAPVHLGRRPQRRRTDRPC